MCKKKSLVGGAPNGNGADRPLSTLLAHGRRSDLQLVRIGGLELSGGQVRLTLNDPAGTLFLCFFWPDTLDHEAT